MAKISLREAVKIFDVSRPTLLKSLKNGKVSAEKDASGNWSIDTSELSRVYKARAGESLDYYGNDGQDFTTFSIERTLEFERKISQLEAAIELEKSKREAAEKLADEREAHIRDLRRLIPNFSNEAKKKWWNIW